LEKAMALGCHPDRRHRVTKGDMTAAASGMVRVPMTTLWRGWWKLTGSRRVRWPGLGVRRKPRVPRECNSSFYRSATLEMRFDQTPGVHGFLPAS
jgi:hypothetical protein